MPTSILQADTSFPWLNKQQTEDEKIGLISNYLFMLLEQLRYSFGNITVENFSEAGLTELGELITKPVWMQLQNDEGDIANLAITAEGLTTRMTNAEGSISSVTQTAAALQVQMATAEGNISTLTQTANGLSARVATAEGNISSLTQTAYGLETRVTNAEGNISTVTQTANKINWIVASGTSASNFQMTDRAIQLVADEIDLTGFVTFSDLSRSGRTTINGDNITTGTIEAIDISACDIAGSTFRAYMDRYGNLDGEIVFNYAYWDADMCGIKFDDSSDGSLVQDRFNMNIYTRGYNGYGCNMTLTAAGTISINPSEAVEIESNEVVINARYGEIRMFGDVYINGTLLPY